MGSRPDKLVFMLSTRSTSVGALPFALSFRRAGFDGGRLLGAASLRLLQECGFSLPPPFYAFVAASLSRHSFGVPHLGF
jgi:hypothetical protein